LRVKRFKERLAQAGAEFQLDTCASASAITNIVCGDAGKFRVWMNLHSISRRLQSASYPTTKIPIPAAKKDDLVVAFFSVDGQHIVCRLN